MERDRVEEVLAGLLVASETMHPEELPGAVAEACERLGGRDAELWLADLSQRRLGHLTAPGDPAREPMEIDGTAAGRAFRTERPVDVAGPGGRRRLWVPVVDSADRLGVLGVTIGDDRDGGEAPPDAAGHRWRALASLTGELVVSKAAYGDHLAVARRDEQLTLAAEMRWALLPPLTFASPAVTVSGVLEPAYDIAGDCFDYAVNGDIAHLALLDAIGHGLEASLMASLAIAGYRNLRRTGVGLAETIMALDRLISQEYGESRFITGQVATLDIDSGVLRLINAGHPRPILVRDGRDLGDLPCEPCRPVGLGSVPSTEAEVALEPGDTVLFHTDGVTEARSTDGIFFGRDRLAGLVSSRLGGGDPVAEVLRTVVRSVIDLGDGRLHDDATLMLVRWQGR